MTNQKGIDAPNKGESSADEPYLDFDMDADRTPSNQTQKDSDRKDSETTAKDTITGTQAQTDDSPESWLGAGGDTEDGDGSDPLLKESADLLDSGTALLNRLKTAAKTTGVMPDVDEFFEFGKHGSPFSDAMVSFRGDDSSDLDIYDTDLTAVLASPTATTSGGTPGQTRLRQPDQIDTLALATADGDDAPKDDEQEKSGDNSKKTTTKRPDETDDTSDKKLLGAGILAAGALAALFARQDSTTDERKDAIKSSLADNAGEADIAALKKIVQEAVIKGDTKTLTEFVEAANETGRMLGNSEQMKGIRSALAEVGVEASWTEEMGAFGQKPKASVLTLKLKDSPKEAKIRSDVGVVALNRAPGEERVEVGDTSTLKEISVAATTKSKTLATGTGGAIGETTLKKDRDGSNPPSVDDTVILPAKPKPQEAKPGDTGASPRPEDTAVLPAKPAKPSPGPGDTAVLPAKGGAPGKPGDTAILPARGTSKASGNPGDTKPAGSDTPGAPRPGDTKPGPGTPPPTEDFGPIPPPPDYPKPAKPGTNSDTTARSGRDGPLKPAGGAGGKQEFNLKVGDQALVDRQWGYLAGMTSDGKAIVQIKSPHDQSTARPAQTADWYTKHGYESIQVETRDGQGKSTGKQQLYYYKGDPQSVIDESRLIMIDGNSEVAADDFKLSDTSQVRALKSDAPGAEVSRTVQRTDLKFDSKMYSVDHKNVDMTYRTYSDGVVIGTPDSSVQGRYYQGNQDIRTYSPDGGKTQIPIVRSHGWFYFANRQSNGEGDAKFHISSVSGPDSANVDRYVIPLLADALSQNPQTEEGRQLSKLVADAKFKDPLNRDARYHDRDTDRDVKEIKIDPKTGEERYKENHIGERGQDSKHFTVYTRTVEDARKAAKIVDDFLARKAAEAPGLILDKGVRTGGLADGKRLEGSNRVSLARETWPYASIVNSTYPDRSRTLADESAGASLEAEIGKETRDYIRKNYGVTGDITQEHLDRLARDAGVKQGLLTFDKDGHLAAHADRWVQSKGRGGDSAYLADGDVQNMTVGGEKQLTGRQAVYALYELVNKGGTPDSRDPMFYVQEQERETRRSYLESRPANLRTEVEFRNLQMLRQSLLNNDMPEFRRTLANIAEMDYTRGQAILDTFTKELGTLSFECKVSRDWSNRSIDFEIKSQGAGRALKLSSRPEVPPVIATHDRDYKRVEIPGAEADSGFKNYHEWLRQNVKYDHTPKPDTRPQEVKDFVNRLPTGFSPESTDFRLLQGLRELAITGDTAGMTGLLREINSLKGKDRINGILSEFSADAEKQGIKVEFKPVVNDGEAAAPVFSKPDAVIPSPSPKPGPGAESEPRPSPRPEPTQQPGKERAGVIDHALARRIAVSPAAIRTGLHHIIAANRPDGARLIEDILNLHEQNKLPTRAQAYLSQDGAHKLANHERMNGLSLLIDEAMGRQPEAKAPSGATQRPSETGVRGVVTSERQATDRHNSLNTFNDAKALPEVRIPIGATSRDGVTELTMVRLADLTVDQLDRRLSTLTAADLKAELDAIGQQRRDLLSDSDRLALDAKARALETAQQMKVAYDKARESGTHQDYVRSLHASLRPKSGASPAEIAKVTGVLGGLLIIFNSIPESTPRMTTTPRLKPGAS